jgi:uncharacterized membrane protein YqiK
MTIPILGKTLPTKQSTQKEIVEVITDTTKKDTIKSKTISFEEAKKAKREKDIKMQLSRIQEKEEIMSEFIQHYGEDVVTMKIEKIITDISSDPDTY